LLIDYIKTIIILYLKKRGDVLNFIELLKIIFLGIVEGITEWLPISSTGHMILVDEFIHLNVTDAFKSMFFVVIQLGAILAVVFIYWNKLFPFYRDKKATVNKEALIKMWAKIITSSILIVIVLFLVIIIIFVLVYNFYYL